MKKTLFFFASILLLPLVVGAYPLTDDECELLKEIEPLSGASIRVQPQANGHIGCSVGATIGSSVIGFGLEIASLDEGSGILDIFKDKALATANSFSASFCETDATTCKEQSVVLGDGTVRRVIDWRSVFKETNGTTVRIVEPYKNHAISLPFSYSRDSGINQLGSVHDEVLVVAKNIIDSRLDVGKSASEIKYNPASSVTVVRVVGEVEVIASSGESRPLIKGETINEGDRIYTSLDSYAIVRFVDGHTVRVRELTDVFVAHLGNDSASIQTRLELKAGDISVESGISSTIKSDFQITTPTATCSVRGTRFSLSYNKESQLTDARVEEGLVEIQSTTGSSEILGAGQRGVVGEDGIIELEVFEGLIDVSDSSDFMWIWIVFVLLLVGVGVWKVKSQ